MDWDEKALDVDQRPHCYRRHADGTLVFEGKGFPRSALAHLAAGDATWEEGNYVYRMETHSRRGALGRDWQSLFAKMGLLAEAHGDDNVRLVVLLDR